MDMKFQFCDVFGLDPDLLGMVPQPCIALLLLFPINEKVKPSSKFITTCIHALIVLVCLSFLFSHSSKCLRRRKMNGSRKKGRLSLLPSSI